MMRANTRPLVRTWIAATVIVWVGALHAIFIPPYLGLNKHLEEKTDAGCGRRSPRRAGSRAGAALHHRGCAPGSGLRNAAWVTCIGPMVWCKPALFSLVQWFLSNGTADTETGQHDGEVPRGPSAGEGRADDHRWG